MDEIMLAVQETLEETVEGEKIDFDKYSEFIEKMSEETKIDPYNQIKEFL